MRGLRCVVALATGTAWAHEAHGDHYLDLAAMMESGASVGSDVTAAPAATPDTSGDVDIFAQMAGATVAPEEQQAVDDAFTQQEAQAAGTTLSPDEQLIASMSG